MLERFLADRRGPSGCHVGADLCLRPSPLTLAVKKMFMEDSPLEEFDPEMAEIIRSEKHRQVWWVLVDCSGCSIRTSCSGWFAQL